MRSGLYGAAHSAQPLQQTSTAARKSVRTETASCRSESDSDFAQRFTVRDGLIAKWSIIFGRGTAAAAFRG